MVIAVQLFMVGSVNMFVDPELNVYDFISITSMRKETRGAQRNPVLAKGYENWRKNGKPGTFFFPRKLDIFWALGCGVIEKSGDCWVWRLMFTEEGVISVEGGPVVD